MSRFIESSDEFSQDQVESHQFSTAAGSIRSSISLALTFEIFSNSLGYPHIPEIRFGLHSIFIRSMSQAVGTFLNLVKLRVAYFLPFHLQHMTDASLHTSAIKNAGRFAGVPHVNMHQTLKQFVTNGEGWPLWMFVFDYVMRLHIDTLEIRTIVLMCCPL